MRSNKQARGSAPNPAKGRALGTLIKGLLLR